MLTRTNSNFIRMNFLAHAYLSFENPGILAGNMISDFLKGSKKNLYSNDIRSGITLHREIDSYTDSHLIPAEARKLFREPFRLYSGPVLDIVYDHFLASDEELFPEKTLKAFSTKVYEQLEAQREQLPPNFLHIFMYMKEQDWLYNYRTLTGLERSLTGLHRRASAMPPAQEAVRIVRNNYDELKENFRNFFPLVKGFAKEKFTTFIKEGSHDVRE